MDKSWKFQARAERELWKQNPQKIEMVTRFNIHQLDFAAKMFADIGGNASHCETWY